MNFIKSLILIIATSLLGFSTFGQYGGRPDSTMLSIFSQSLDSVEYYVFDYSSKEMTAEGQEEHERQMGGVYTLSDLDEVELLKQLSDSSSYSNERALLTHHSLIFKLYYDTNFIEVQISLMTKNINISDEAKDLYVYAGITDKFRNRLVILLERYGVLMFGETCSGEDCNLDEHIHTTYSEDSTEVWWYKFHENGRVREFGEMGQEFGCGMKTGIHKFYSIRGILIESIEYTNWLPKEEVGCHETIQDQLIITYHPRGAIKSRKMLQSSYQGDSYRAGVWEEFDLDGKLTSSKDYGMKYKD